MAWAARLPSLAQIPDSESPSVGNSIAVMSSPGCRTVERKPVKKSSRRTVRSAPLLAMTTIASSASSAEIVSLAGLAVAMLPAIVARLRSCGDPISRQAWASGSATTGSSGCPATSLWVVSAPSRTMPSAMVIPRSSRIGVRSRSVTGSPGPPRCKSSRRSVPPATGMIDGSSASATSASDRLGKRRTSSTWRPGRCTGWRDSAAIGRV